MSKCPKSETDSTTIKRKERELSLTRNIIESAKLLSTSTKNINVIGRMCGDNTTWKFRSYSEASEKYRGYLGKKKTKGR